MLSNYYFVLISDTFNGGFRNLRHRYPSYFFSFQFKNAPRLRFYVVFRHFHSPNKTQLNIKVCKSYSHILKTVYDIALLFVFLSTIILSTGTVYHVNLPAMNDLFVLV